MFRFKKVVSTWFGASFSPLAINIIKSIVMKIVFLIGIFILTANFLCSVRLQLGTDKTIEETTSSFQFIDMMYYFLAIIFLYFVQACI